MYKRQIQRFATPLLDNVFLAITVLGEPVAILVPILVIYYCYNKKMGLFLAFSSLTSQGVNAGVKALVGRGRPIGQPGIRSLRTQTAGGSSMPSGHTQGAVTLLYSIYKFVKQKSMLAVADVYKRQVFEFVSTSIGAQGTVCGGGRYDGLLETLGGPSTPAIGFAVGLQRLLAVMEQDGASLGAPPACDIFLASIGQGASVEAQKLAPVSYTHLSTILAMIEILEQNGDSWNDTLPITLTEPFAFAPYQVPDGEDEPSEEKVEATIAKVKRQNNLNVYATAENVMDKLIDTYDLQEYDRATARKIAGVRYEMVERGYSLSLIHI